MNKHMALVHVKKKICKVCDETSSYKQNTRKHIASVHERKKALYFSRYSSKMNKSSKGKIA